MMIEVLLMFSATALCVIALIAVINALTFPRLCAASGEVMPFVSVLIPARNEAAVIATTIRALLAQDYPHFEIILLDDNSSDGTGEIARAAANDDPRVRVINGDPLPAGWFGKNWACQQLSRAARGDVLVFTDADVQWTPRALSALIAHMEQHNADLLTVWSTQITITWGERLIVPLMAWVILGYLPAPAVHHTPFEALAAANGQCLAFRRAAYDRVGGHEAVRAAIIEDITFARLIKRAGLRLRMADGAGLIACRMYDGWRAVRDGYAKNIMAGYGGVIALLLATVFHWLILIVPPVWLALGWIAPSPWYPALPLALTLLAISIRALTAAITRQRLIDALLLPISALLMTVIAFRAWVWHVRGAPMWKGRALK